MEKRRCITEEKNKRKTKYVLKDSMFKFWYEFIPKACSVIEMCQYYTLKEGIAGKFNCFLTETGTWWGTEVLVDEQGGKTTRQADIDVVGLSAIDKVMVVGECKFKNEKIDRSIYETLVRRSKAIPAKYRITRYLFFSLSGYTKWFDEIDRNEVCLFTLDDLYR